MRERYTFLWEVFRPHPQNTENLEIDVKKKHLEITVKIWTLIDRQTKLSKYRFRKVFFPASNLLKTCMGLKTQKQALFSQRQFSQLQSSQCVSTDQGELSPQKTVSLTTKS